MLNIGKIRPGGAEYYVGEIATSAEDYYLGDGEAPGRWVGSLAHEMGLVGQVDPEHFRAVLTGRHPISGELLVDARPRNPSYISQAPPDEWLDPRQAAVQLGVSDRFVRQLLSRGDLHGEKGRSESTGRVGWRVQRAEINAYAATRRPAKSRPGFDLTLRPPKSVSVLWAMADPEQRSAIRQAHTEAVDEVVRYYEGQAVFARTGGSRIQTAGLVAAAFDHRTSRAGDPLLHTHVVVANLTLTVADTWRALDGRPLYDHATTGGHLYQAHLRHVLTDRLGLEWGPVVNGCADVVGVPRHVIEEFSQRRHEIEEMLTESGYTSARAGQAATLASRVPKDRTVDPDTLVRGWRNRAAELGFGAEAVDACFARLRAVEPREADIERLLDRLAGPHGLTERASTFTRRHVVRALAGSLGPSATAAQIEGLADRFLASARVVVLAGPTAGRNSHVVIGLDGRKVRTGGTALFTTPELLSIEERLLGWDTSSRRLGGIASPDSIEHALAGRPELSVEQVAMVRAVCTGRDLLQPVVGHPGSGKTYAAAACAEAFVASGIPVAGCAVSAAAAAELERTAGFERLTGRRAETIARLLVDLDDGRSGGIADGAVLFVDEASMVGTRDLARLAQHLMKAGGSLTMIGDPDQHPAVDTGGMFRMLAARRGGQLIRLVENRRQVEPGERQAIHEYRHGNVGDALAMYDDAGKVVRGPTAEATNEALVADWWSDRLKGSTSPMVAGTNAVRRSLNERAHHLMKERGVLAGPALMVAGREFMVGDEVVARRNNRHLHAPASAAFVKNGSTGTIVGVDVERGELTVAFDREGTIRLPASYVQAGHVEHGYARTTYGVQGATHDIGRYQPSDRSGFEEGYVAITRARERTHLYIVEGDIDSDDDTTHGAFASEETGMGTIAEAMARRSDKRLAHESDPAAAAAAALASRRTLAELQARCSELELTLRREPPAVDDALAGLRRRQHALVHRREELLAQQPGWMPSHRRAHTQELASLARRIAGNDIRIELLEQQRSKRDRFRASHAQELAEYELVRHATLAKRLQIEIQATVDPGEEITRLLGPRPTQQRRRLEWERAIETMAVYKEETEWFPPEGASPLERLLGGRPPDGMDRRRFENVLEAFQRATPQEPDQGIDLDLGLP